MVKGAVLITFKDSRRSLRVPCCCLVGSSSPTLTLPPPAFPSSPALTLSRSCKNPRPRQTPFVCTVTLTLSLALLCTDCVHLTVLPFLYAPQPSSILTLVFAHTIHHPHCLSQQRRLPPDLALTIYAFLSCLVPLTWPLHFTALSKWCTLLTRSYPLCLTTPKYSHTRAESPTYLHRTVSMPALRCLKRVLKAVATP